jgi:GNAT superfamily N-acetyltransferase
MSSEPGYQYRVLGIQDQDAFQGHTFPALRHWLGQTGNGNAFAVGAQDERGLPAGLVLGHLMAEPDGMAARLASIHVRPDCRSQGIGTKLLAAFTQGCVQRGLPRIHATYMTGHACTPWLEKLFSRGTWTVPEPRMLVIQATLASIAPAPWMKAYRLPERMEIVRWQDLTPGDRAWIEATQQEQAWIPADLNPFDHEAGCEPMTSLALKLEGCVVGWVINHRVDDVLRFTCSFMHRRLQRMGRILLLYNEAVTRMPQAGLQTGMWTVPVWHPAMLAFARRWMAPYATRFDETRGTRLDLPAAQPTAK